MSHGVRVRGRSFISDAVLTGFVQAIILAANLVMVGLVNRWMGLAVLAEYLLVKRIASWLLSVSHLCFGSALPWQIAQKDGEEESARYFAAAWCTLAVYLGVAGCVCALNARWLARWCVGSTEPGIIYALILLVFGSGVHTLVFAYYRGLQQMILVNQVMLVGLVLVPFFALAVARKSNSASLLLGLTGAGMAATALAWSLPKFSRAKGLRQKFCGDARTLLSYGVPRVPGALAEGALLALVPVMLAHRVPREQLPGLLLGITGLTMTGMAIWPLGIMLLPKVRRLLADGRSVEVVALVSHLRSALLQLSLLATTQAVIFAAPVLHWWLGERSAPRGPEVVVLLLAIPAYLYFVGLQSVMDAASPVAYGTRNMLISLVLLCPLTLAALRLPSHWLLPGAAAAITVSLYTLAWLTDRTLHRLQLASRPPSLQPVSGILVVAALSALAQWAFHFKISKLGFCSVELGNTVLLLLFLRWSQPQWMLFLRRTALVRATA